MRKIISLLAALSLSLCLTAAAFADSGTQDHRIPVFVHCDITANYYQITLGGADTVTLPDNIVLQGASSQAADDGLRVIIIPLTPAGEPDAFAWAAKTAVTLGREPIIYYLMTYRDSTPAPPSGEVRITMTTRSGYENALLYYMDGSAETTRLRYDTTGGTVFSLRDDGYYMFLKSPSDSGHHPTPPAELPVTPPTTGDSGIGVYAAAALASAAGFAWLSRKRQKQA